MNGSHLRIVYSDGASAERPALPRIASRARDANDSRAEAADPVLTAARTQYGDLLSAYSHRTPLLLVFLRPLSCPFAREALAELAEQRAKIEAAGIRIALIHLETDDERARLMLAERQLADLPRVADPTRRLYGALGLHRAPLRELIRGRVVARWFHAAVRRRFGFGWPLGDPFQLAGTFLVADGELVRGCPLADVSERMDYSLAV